MTKGEPVAVPSVKITILKVLPLNNIALLNYLRERSIDLEIAKKHCKELYYMAGGKRYFGIGFKNNKGGYEIRNKYFKGSTSKDITSVNLGITMHMCNVFEGFMDYLSYLTINKQNKDTWNTVILNSVNNVHAAKDFLLQHNAISCYLDNDDAGRKAVQTIREFDKSKRVMNQSEIYKNHKDLNEYLTKQPRQQQKQPTTKHHL